MENKEFDRRYKISEADKIKIIEMKLEGESQAMLASKFGISQPHVSRIISDYLKGEEYHE